MLNKPYIHLYKTPGGKYVYDVNKNVIVSLKDEVYNLLWEETVEKVWNDESSWNVLLQNEMIKSLKENGFLEPTSITEVVNPANDVVEFYLDSRTRMMTLQVTQQCNLRCEYCVYSDNYVNRGHANNRMSFETAKKCIDFLFAHSRGRKSINLGFYGGEPLLEFELIKKCVSYAKENASGRAITFNMTTNGTLLNSEIVKFLQENDFSVLISLDGPKNIHDKNRKFAYNNCGTFDKVMENLQMVLKEFPAFAEKIAFNTVIDPSCDLSCTNEFFLNYDTIKDFKHSQKNAQFISDNTLSEDSQLHKEQNENFDKDWNYEVFKLYLSKFDKVSEKRVSPVVSGFFAQFLKYNDMLKHKTVKLNKAHHGGPCVPGVTRLFMNYKGSIYPCERVAESSEIMNIGDVDSGFDLEKIKTMMNVGKLTENKCKTCWAFRFCGLCVAYADDNGKYSADAKLGRCEMIKRSAHDTLVDYTTLKELGHDFDQIGNAPLDKILMPLNIG